MNPEPKWLWPNSNPPYVPPELPFRNTYGLKSDYGPGGINHGSGMLSRAVGPSWGVSQSADVTVVKVAEPIRGTMDPQNQPLTGMRRVNGIDALVEALLDIKSRGLANRAVVSVSWVFLPDALNNPPRPTEQLDYVMYTTVKAMIDYGVIFVGATGNNGDPSAVSLKLIRTINNADSLVLAQLRHKRLDFRAINLEKWAFQHFRCGSCGQWRTSASIGTVSFY